MSRHVVHVVECFAGGTLEVVRQLANHQARSGWAVTIVHGYRADTPSEAVLETLLDQGIDRIPVAFSDRISPLADLKCLIALVALFRRQQASVIHLHSSKAGLLGRIAARLLRLHGITLFTPHSWSFLRRDVPAWQRSIFLTLEWLGARLGGTIVACSTREAELAIDRLRAREVVLLRNGLSLPPTTGHASPESQGGVVCVGRLTAQKAPWRFAALARQSSDDTAWTWVGDGDPTHGDALRQAGVTVTGQVSREQVAALVSRARVFVLLSGWEGLPLALIEAQALGIPAVVSDIPGCREVIEHGINGFVAGSDLEAAGFINTLLTDTQTWARMSDAARTLANERFSPARFLREADQLYQRLTPAH